LELTPNKVGYFDIIGIEEIFRAKRAQS
jgi:hypothetical protein